MNKTIIMSLALAASALTCAAAGSEGRFPIGKQWLDTDGKHINCHGGCVVYDNGKYYWFGESRTGGHSDGISVYSSSDLYNWQNLGMAVVHQGDRDDENLQDISEGRLLERPKVIHNAATGKWVMWAHWENGKDYGEARVAVLESDKLTGPYTFVRTMRPNGHDSRDQTLFLDTDGKAYHFCSTDMNTNINVVRLTDDFLNASPNETKIMNGRRLEATTVCKYGDTYFATFSECKGWDPAPGHSATAVGDILGTWTEGENFCVDPDENRSYGSQGAYVFSVADMGYDPKCFIFYGDRWIPSNVGGSTYVWLPMSIRSGYPTVRNHTDWNLDEVMRDMYRYKRAAAIADGGEYALLERASDRLLSRVGLVSGFCVMDDNDAKNVSFVFEKTADPYVWKLRDADSGKYLVSHAGSMRLEPAGNDKKALWRFELLPDGYYRIVNEDSNLCITRTGARYEGGEVTLANRDKTAAQAFGVYFDSKKHNYTEADMYSKEYFKKVAEEMEKQGTAEDNKVVSEAFATDVPFAIGHVRSERSLTPVVDGQGSSVTIADHKAADNQKLTFKKTEGGYNIVDALGNYLAKGTKDNWTMVCGSDIDPTTDEAIFTVETVGHHIVIRNKANGGYLGTNGGSHGSHVYCDKSKDSELSMWYLTSFDKMPVVPGSGTTSAEDAFIQVFDRADFIMGSVDTDLCGDGAFDYSQTAFDALKRAYEHALTVTSDYEAEAQKLEEALDEFEKNKYVAPDPDKAYFLEHTSGLRLAHAADNAVPVLAEADGAPETRFAFVDNGDGTYGIQSVHSGDFLAKDPDNSNAWVMGWTRLTDTRHTKWKVMINTMGNKVLYNMFSRGYMGSDATAAGSQLYCNKAEYENYAQWSISDAGVNAIDGISTDAELAIALSGNTVSVDACGVTLTVVDLAGRTVANVSADYPAVTLPAGLYIVHAATATASATRKVAVK